MARSKFIWCVTYDDFTVDFVKAQTVWQILDNCDKLSNDIDNIVNINRIELTSIWDDDIKIDIPYQD